LPGRLRVAARAVEGSEDRCQTSRLKNVERKTGLLTWVARTLTVVR
jgi:hypothetical protein